MVAWLGCGGASSLVESIESRRGTTLTRQLTYDWHETERPLFTEAAHPLAPEDPFVWATPDPAESSLMHFHALFHHRSCTASWVTGKGYASVDCGGMGAFCVFLCVFFLSSSERSETFLTRSAYSDDGVAWHYADITGTAYRPLVECQGGDSYHFARRERPHLVFDGSGAIVLQKRLS